VQKFICPIGTRCN